MSSNDNPEPLKPRTVNTTYAFATHLVGELDAPAAQGLESRGSAAKGGSTWPRLLVVRGPNVGTEFPLDRDIVSAGRAPECRIWLDDVTVSRQHVEFRRQNGKFRVFDLDSLNNTYVNQDPIYSAELAHGDEIQIGTFRLRFLAKPATD